MNYSRFNLIVSTFHFIVLILYLCIQFNFCSTSGPSCSTAAVHFWRVYYLLSIIYIYYIKPVLISVRYPAFELAFIQHLILFYTVYTVRLHYQRSLTASSCTVTSVTDVITTLLLSSTIFHYKSTIPISS